MMKGSALLETMSRQVEAECDRHASQASEEAGAIMAEAHAQGDTQRESTLAATRAEMQRLDTLWKQKAEAEMVRAELSMKNETVEAVLAGVADEIRSIVGGSSFPAILDALMAEVMEAATEQKDIVVLGPEAHVDRLKSWLDSNGHDSVTVEGSSEFWDGVAVQDRDRRYRISNTLTGRFQRVVESIRKQCMTTIFGDASTDGD